MPVKLFASRFQIMMAVRGGTASVIKLSEGDDFGLYPRRFRNEIGSIIAARGTRVQIESLVGEVA